MCVCMLACAKVEDSATGRATKGSHCNLYNRHKHVYCSALSHWREGSHNNPVRCCAQSLLFGDVLFLLIIGIAEGRYTRKYMIPQRIFEVK